MSAEPNTESRGPTPADIKALIEAERTGLAFLHWRTDAGLQSILLLDGERQRVTIGRRSDSDISLIWDLEVSRAHALLEAVGGQWTVVDDGLSRNGTHVNGSRVHGRRRLNDRDRLCCGRTVIVFREVENPDASATTARANQGAPAIPLSETHRKILIALCRPVVDSDSARATPATNREIALEVSHSVESVKSHLRLLFDRFGLGDLPQNEKRAHLAGRVLADQLLKPHEF